MPELLRQLERLRHHALLRRVVPALDEAGQRKVLAQRVTLEAVVGQDAAQVGVALCGARCARERGVGGGTRAGGR